MSAAASANTWDARVGRHLGEHIDAYLAEQPQPPGSRLADELADTAGNPLRAGERAADGADA